MSNDFALMASSSRPSPTPSRLEWDDPSRTGFAATVVQCTTFGGRPSIVLDQSCFYPESGGQMGDHGVLTIGANACQVLDTQIDDAKVVHHIVDDTAILATAGDPVVGAIDIQRRRENACLHTGQHVLSSALLREWGANTMSSRLGETGCNIDLDKDGVNEAKIANAEALANHIVDSALAVQQFFPTSEQLSAIAFRRTPKVLEGIRVVTVGDFDVTPCGGTHVRNSAEVGLIRVTSVERAKGRVRVMFESGPRARRTLFAAHTRMRELASTMTCSEIELPHALGKLRDSLQSTRSALQTAQARLAEGECATLLERMRAQGEHLVTATFSGDANFLRQLAPRLLDGGAQVVVLAGVTDDGIALFCARSDVETAFDCGAFVKALTKECGGKGGGKAERAEGRLPPQADVGAAIARVLS